MPLECSACRQELRTYRPVMICVACQRLARSENKGRRMSAGECLEYLTKKAQLKWIGMPLRYGQGLRPTI